MPTAEVVRVFTRGAAGGNLLGVIEDSTGLTSESMQSIAAELGFSETVFLVSETDGAPDVRIFTPAMELGFAGHPLVGTAWVLNQLRGRGVTTLRCGVGPVSTDFDGRSTWIDTALGQPCVVVDGDVGVSAGLPEPMRAWEVSMPLDYLLYELDSAEQVAALAPDFAALSGRFLLMAFARSGDQVAARVFVPSAGVPEDPATGSAAVALAQMLTTEGEHSGLIEIAQGDQIAAPSTIHLEWADGRARIGGTVCQDQARSISA
jgi:trans-2,3-dihydro-3-hydroxyanthranilate isomerase